MNTARLSAGIAAAALLIGCGESTPVASHTEHEENTVTDATSSGSLADQLDEYRAGFAQRAPQETQTLYQDRIDELRDTGITEQALNVGDVAPDFTLAGADGTEVALSTLLEDGPVILNWYRGGWCPYCNLTLRAYQARLGEIEAAGATFVAITPETPDNSLSTSEKNELAFPVLSDPGNSVARQYKVVFTLQDDLASIYNEKFDLNGYNGDDSNELPLAATYVIDTDRTIRFAFLSADYRERAEPDTVIDAARAIAQGS